MNQSFPKPPQPGCSTPQPQPTQLSQEQLQAFQRQFQNESWKSVKKKLKRKGMWVKTGAKLFKCDYKGFRQGDYLA